MLDNSVKVMEFMTKLSENDILIIRYSHYNNQQCYKIKLNLNSENFPDEEKNFHTMSWAEKYALKKAGNNPYKGWGSDKLKPLAPACVECQKT